MEQQREGTVGEVIDGRVSVYGDPTVTFQQIATMWSGYLNTEVKATDVPLMLNQMKMVRTRQAPDYSDNSDDMEGYLDIFRQLVGEDMIHARSVTEYVEKKAERRKAYLQQHALPGTPEWRERFGAGELAEPAKQLLCDVCNLVRDADQVRSDDGRTLVCTVCSPLPAKAEITAEMVAAHDYAAARARGMWALSEQRKLVQQMLLVPSGQFGAFTTEESRAYWLELARLHNIPVQEQS